MPNNNDDNFNLAEYINSTLDRNDTNEVSLTVDESTNQIIDYSISDENCFVISKSDLNHNGDFLHFDSESQRKLGYRFAISYLDNVIK